MAAATVGAVGEGAGARLGRHHPPLGSGAQPPQGAGASRPAASGGRRDGAGGFYMLGGAKRRAWGGWANGSEGGARRGRGEWAGPGRRCGRGRRVPGAWGEPGGAAAAWALQRAQGMGGHLGRVALESPLPLPSHSQYTVCATSQASVFHPVKWGESLLSSLFCISGTPDSFQKFL